MCRYRKDRELAAKAVVTPTPPKPRQAKKRPAGKIGKTTTTDNIYDADFNDDSNGGAKRANHFLPKIETGLDERSSSVIMSTPPPTLPVNQTTRVINTANSQSQSLITTPLSSQMSPVATDENVYIDLETKSRYYANHVSHLNLTNTQLSNNANGNNNVINNFVINNNSHNVAFGTSGQSTLLGNHNSSSQVTPMGISFQSNCIRAAHHEQTTPKSSQSSQWCQRNSLGDHHKPAKLKRRWLEAALEQSYEEGRVDSAARSPSVSHVTITTSATTTSSTDSNNQYDIYISNNNNNDKRNHNNNYSNGRGGNSDNQVDNYFAVKYENDDDNDSSFQAETNDDGYFASSTATTPTNSSVRPSVLVMARSASNSPSPVGPGLNENSATLAAANTLLNLRNEISPSSQMILTRCQINEYAYYERV